VRQQTFEQQKKLGIIPQDAVLPPRSRGIPAWDSFSAIEKRVLARQAEVCAPARWGGPAVLDV
jgi:arylsulfatase A-like enzyme